MPGRILQIILPVFAIVAVGFAYGRRRRPDISAANQMNVDVFVPALILSALTRREFDLWQSRGLVLGVAAVVVGSGLLAWPVARWLRADPRTFVPPMMFNNSGNMGLPLMLLAFGEAHLPAAVAIFVTSNLLHFTLGAWLLRGAGPAHLVRNPIVLATALGVALPALKVALPGWLAVALGMLGDVCLPLMLFTLGVRMAGARLAGGWRLGVAGAVVCPLAGLAVALPLAGHLGIPPVHQAMLVIFGALPPAVLNYMLAEQCGQEPEQVASIVLIGNFASLAFVPAGLALALR
jgi:predicted permease